MFKLKEILERKIPAEKRNKKVGHIYFLIKNDQVVYVGQTIQVPEIRIYAHEKEGKDFDYYSVFECPVKDLDFCEFACIIEYDPILNHMIPQNPYIKTLNQVKKELGVNGWDLKKAINKNKIQPVFRDFYNFDEIVKAVESL